MINDKTYIIKADNWFPAPDGESYLYVWGKVQVILAKDLLGVVPNKSSVNWYARVGDENNFVLLAGCQVHFACISPQPPKNKYKQTWNNESGYEKAPSHLYIAAGEIKYKDIDYLKEETFL